VPLFAFAEACIGIGLLVSGAFLLLVATTLYSTGIAPLAVMIPLAMIAAMLGDHTGFYAGRWLGPRLHGSRLSLRYRQRIHKAEAMVRRHGAWAIFIGRFIPAIRSLIPAALGISDFDRLRYSILDALACALWATALAGLVLALDAGFLS
jgi:membrane-associated protein